MLLIPSVTAPGGDWDGTPTVLGETTAVGVAVVASDIPGLSEFVIKGKTGILSALGDVTAMVARLQEVRAQSDISAACAEHAFKRYRNQREVAKR